MIATGSTITVGNHAVRGQFSAHFSVAWMFIWLMGLLILAVIAVYLVRAW